MFHRAFLCLLFVCLSLPFYSYALTKQQLARDVAELVKRGDTEFIKMLSEYGYEIKQIHSTVLGKQAALNDDFHKITKINNISRSIRPQKFRDVEYYLEKNGVYYNRGREQLLKQNSLNFCRQFYHRVRQEMDFYRCSFRYIVTLKQFAEDEKNCKRDAEALYDDNTDRLFYICMRKAGWRDPLNATNNIDHKKFK